MTEWQPQITKIQSVQKHPNADALEIATILGDYPCIIKTNQYHQDDIISYIPVDSIVPDTEQFYFLSPPKRIYYEENGETKERLDGPQFPLGSVPEKYRRIKAKKIRGIYSMGLIVDPIPNLNLGDSIVETLSLKKYEEEEEENIVLGSRKRADTASPPKGWAIPYYDIDGLRKYWDAFSEIDEVVITEKIHGSNSSYIYHTDTFWVKSRNIYKKRCEEDAWWDIAIRYNLEEKLKNYPEMVFFGEMYGQIKNFRYDSKVINGKLLSNIRFFDIYSLKSMRYLDYDHASQILDELNLPKVPELYRGPFPGKEKVKQMAEGTTTLSNHVREGVVIKTTKETIKHFGRLQLKLVGEGYSLKK